MLAYHDILFAPLHSHFFPVIVELLAMLAYVYCICLAGVLFRCITDYTFTEVHIDLAMALVVFLITEGSTS